MQAKVRQIARLFLIRPAPPCWTEKMDWRSASLPESVDLGEARATQPEPHKGGFAMSPELGACLGLIAVVAAIVVLLLRKTKRKTAVPLEEAWAVASGARKQPEQITWAD
jgi:hypothetical protein